MRIRESFTSRYRDSLRYCKELKKGKLLRTDTYKDIHDEHWARCFVFDYFQISSCVKSREQLLAELNLMVDRKITPFGAFNREIFEKYRISTVKQLIAEFQENT